MKTQLGDDEKPVGTNIDPCIPFPLLGMFHQANVCVCCNRFISGTGNIKWINKAILLSHEVTNNSRYVGHLYRNK